MLVLQTRVAKHVKEQWTRYYHFDFNDKVN